MGAGRVGDGSAPKASFQSCCLQLPKATACADVKHSYPVLQLAPLSLCLGWFSACGLAVSHDWHAPVEIMFGELVIMMRTSIMVC